MLKEEHIAEAAAAYQESLDLVRALADAAPSNRRWRRDLAVGMTNLADAFVLLPKPRSAEAIALYREALDIMRKLSTLDPYNTTWETELAFLLDRLARAGDATRERAIRDIDNAWPKRRSTCVEWANARHTRSSSRRSKP